VAKRAAGEGGCYPGNKKGEAPTEKVRGMIVNCRVNIRRAEKGKVCKKVGLL